MLVNPSNIISEQSEEISSTNSPQKDPIMKQHQQLQSDIIIMSVISDTKIIPFSGKGHLENCQPGISDSNGLNIVQQGGSKDTEYLASSIQLNQINGTHSNNKAQELLQVQNSQFAFTRDSYLQEPKPRVFYREIENYYLSLFQSSENDIVVKKERGNECCLYKLLYIFNSKFTLSSELCRERDYFLFLSKIPFNYSFELHANIINTIFYAFNENFVIKSNSAIFSIEGMIANLLLSDNNNNNQPMSILPLTYSMILIDKYHHFLSMNLDKLTNKATGHNYLFVLIRHISDIIIDIIKSEKLIIYFNRKKSVSNTVNEFFLGLIEQVMSELNSQFESMAEIDKKLLETALLKIRETAFELPSSILWKYKIFIEKYPEEKDSVSFNSISHYST